MIALDIISSVAGFALPVVSDLVKSIFGSKSTPRATLNTLATTKPEVIAEYVKANAVLMEAETKFFQRDVVGELSRWVRDLRGAIRPIGTAVCAAALTFNHFIALNLTPGTEASFCFIVSSWFGSRVK